MLSLHFSSPDMEVFISGALKYSSSLTCVCAIRMCCMLCVHTCVLWCMYMSDVYTCALVSCVGGVEHACALYVVHCVTCVVCCMYAHACMPCAHAPRVVCGAHMCCMCHVHTHVCYFVCYASACACVLCECSCVDACIMCAWVWCGVWCVCMRVCHTPWLAPVGPSGLALGLTLRQESPFLSPHSPLTQNSSCFILNAAYVRVSHQTTNPLTEGSHLSLLLGAWGLRLRAIISHHKASDWNLEPAKPWTNHKYSAMRTFPWVVMSERERKQGGAVLCSKTLSSVLKWLQKFQ